MDVGEGWAELAVSVPATQHELIETLRTHSGPAQIYLQKKARRRYMDVSPLLRHSLYLFICDKVLTITYKYEKNLDFPLLLINMSYNSPFGFWAAVYRWSLVINTTPELLSRIMILRMY